mgnify:FL=1|tara:strand:- start:1224 stop:1397 length:174 start_codon:yes stop_codon:yes gene_type:complete
MIEIGDYVIPKIVGMMEPGDPPYRVTEISKDNIYTIVQTIKSYKHTLLVPEKKLRKV